MASSTEANPLRVLSKAPQDLASCFPQSHPSLYAPGELNNSLLMDIPHPNCPLGLSG